MTIKLEKDIERQFCEWVEQQGGKTWKWSGKREKLDRIVLTHTGVIGLLEIKKPGGVLSPQQKKMLKQIARIDTCLTEVCDNLEDCKKWYILLAFRRKFISDMDRL